MRVEPARIGARMADSLAFSQSGTWQQAQAMKADGVDGIYGYLGVINATRLQYILDMDMAFMPVTLAAHYDGPTSVAQLHGLGLAAMKKLTACVDVEGMAAFHSDPIALAASVDAWSGALIGADYTTGGYFGSPQPFTSYELWKLRITTYWRGQGSIRDRHDALAEPTHCGFGITQSFPSAPRGGVMCDCDQIGADYLGRVPFWLVSTD